MSHRGAVGLESRIDFVDAMTPPPPNSLSLVPNVVGGGSCRVGSPKDVSPRVVLVSCA